MSLSKISGLILGSAALVAGHGYVSGIVVDDTYYGGYLVTEYPYESDPPELIAWSEQETDLGYIDGSEYANSNIICHKDAQPGALEAPVKAGGSVELQWTTWPTSHHGPVITYMANCNGDCDDVDKTTLEFFKIDQGGLISDTTEPGTWASDKLIANNNSRTVTVPSDIADGNYVLRHEIIALHSAEETNGAQNYPQCINLKVTGGGSATPSGTLGTALYKNTDPGILINIYTSLSTYDIPGPTLYTAGAAAATAASTAAAVTTADAVTTAAAVTTASAEVTSSPASVEVVPTTTPSSSIVSAFPTWSPSSTPPFSNSSNGWRPSFSRGPGGPRFTSAPAPQFSAPSGAQQKQSATATPTVATPVVITMTETSTSWVTEMVTLTDKSVVQTTSAIPVVVAVTTTITEGSEPVQTVSPSVVSGSSSSGSSSESSGSSSSGSTSSSGSSSTTSKTSGESDYVSSDWMSYLSSLSAAEVLQLLRQTFRWMVSNDKVHARDITIN